MKLCLLLIRLYIYEIVYAKKIIYKQYYMQIRLYITLG